MLKKSNRKRLNESQQCEIIAKLSKTDAHSKKREYDVSEGAIRKVWEKAGGNPIAICLNV